MLGEYIYKIRGLMNIKRYQNKFRFKKRSIAEHEWSVARIAHGLALWHNEFNENKVDVGDVIQRALLHDSIKLYTGDIQANVMEVTPNMRQAFDEVKQICFETKFQKLVPESWRTLFRDKLLYAKDESLEGKIFTVANYIDILLECTEEIRLGNKEYFQRILQQTAKKILSLDIEVANWFLIYCLEDFGIDIQQHFGEEISQFIINYHKESRFAPYQHTFGIYVYQIRGLMEIERYQNLHKLKVRNVAQHEWSVSRIAHALALVEINKFGSHINMEKLLTTSLIHDTPEFIVGDILSYVKRSTESMNRAVEEAENVIFDEVIAKMLPQSWIEVFRKPILQPKDDTLEGKIISAADIIDTMLESIEEIKLGNTEHFETVLHKAIKKLEKFDIPSVRFFVEHSLKDFGI